MENDCVSKADQITVLFNSCTLGGAERSMLEQSCQASEYANIDFVVLKIKDSPDEISPEIIKKMPSASIQYLEYPQALFGVSRAARRFYDYIVFPFLVSLVIYRLGKLDLNEKTALWANGNKVAIPLIAWAVLFGYNGRLVWHHRDYFSFHKKTMLSLLKLSRKYLNKFKLLFVANSQSVLENLSQSFKDCYDDIFLLYNESGFKDFDFQDLRRDRKIKNIGVMSMLTPWKGVHQVVVMANLYQDKLKELGIENIYIYGDSIYQTNACDEKYKHQLKNLCDNSIVKFMGNVAPAQAYPSFDLLIHPSIREEPFGRVLLESFLQGVVVVSSALGGASELVQDGQTGVVFFNYDYHGLFESISKIAQDELFSFRLRKNAFKKGMEIESTAREQLIDFLKYLTNKKIVQPEELYCVESSACL